MAPSGFLFRDQKMFMEGPMLSSHVVRSSKTGVVRGSVAHFRAVKCVR